MKLPPWVTKMNRRERILAGIVGGVFFGLINLFLWTSLFGAIGRARADLATNKMKREEQAMFMKDRPIWTKRDEWLQQHQPALKNSGEAQTGLLDQLKQTATKYDILIENPAIGAGETTPNHQAVFASIETRSPWPPLVHFLYDVQQPDSFVVFESVNLAVDSNDATTMRGKFKIARWFAPPQKKKG
jgi:hypothetical protein